MHDQPDVTNGTRQPSGHIVTDFRLNEAFVAAVGLPKAQQTLHVFTHVAAGHARHRDEIKDALKLQLRAIGVHFSDVEIDSVADELSRSERTLVGDDVNPYDVGGEHVRAD